MICVRLRPRVRRVSSRTLVLKRATACGAMRRRGASFPPVKLKPRNLRTLGLATALLALFIFSLSRLARSFSMPAITRSPARLHDTRAQECTDELQDALVTNPLGNKPHQDVVVDPVEELFQVDIHDKAVAGRVGNFRKLVAVTLCS